MITEIRVTDRKKCVSWWDEAPALIGKESIEFKNGLNIIWAPNGAGKSTILTAIARTMQCEEAFVPTISQRSVDKMNNSSDLLDGLEITHNGELCFYFNPDVNVGMIDGYANDDFLKEIILHKANAYSSGTDVQDKVVNVLAALRDEELGFDRKITKNSVNDLWKERIDAVEKILEGDKTIKGPRTLLLDEPCRSIDLPRQRQLWDVIENYADHFQIIIATHNPMALYLDKAHYIDIEEGFLAECREAFPQK